MKSTGERLVTMANQIAAFFSAYPHDEAVEGTLDHIQSFWDPRMKKQILELQPEEGRPELSPIAADAIARLRDRPRA